MHAQCCDEDYCSCSNLQCAVIKRYSNCKLHQSLGVIMSGVGWPYVPYEERVVLFSDRLSSACTASSIKAIRAGVGWVWDRDWERGYTNTSLNDTYAQIQRTEDENNS